MESKSLPEIYSECSCQESVVTLIGPVELFVTVIKMKSIKGSTCQFVLNQAIKECFKEMIKQLIVG